MMMFKMMTLSTSEKKIINVKKNRNKLWSTIGHKEIEQIKYINPIMGLLEACWIQIKNIHFSPFREDKKARQ